MYRCILCQKDFEGEGTLVDLHDLNETLKGNVVFNSQTAEKVFLCDGCWQEYLKNKNFEEEV